MECPICLDTKRCVTQPRCDHLICIECLKRYYYGNDIDLTNFPYPEIEEEYDNDPDNIKWDNEYPLIKKWNDELNKLLDEDEIEYESTEYLRKCPLCRR